MANYRDDIKTEMDNAYNKIEREADGILDKIKQSIGYLSELKDIINRDEFNVDDADSAIYNLECGLEVAEDSLYELIKKLF